MRSIQAWFRIVVIVVAFQPTVERWSSGSAEPAEPKGLTVVFIASPDSGERP
jgi:hypothetical protein